jgi:haloacetate dehalogenase
VTIDGFHESNIEVAPGVGLHVRTAGSGTPIVLLHGYPQHGGMWRLVAPRLAEHHTVVVPDLRGYGRSSTPPDDAEHSVYSKRTMANDVVALMSALGHERFAVVGHDRGGRVAYRTALDHPARVERLCTLDIIPTVEQFELLSSSRRAAVGGFHWYFLAVQPPLPEALIGAEPRLYLEQVMARWAGTVPGSQGISAEAMDDYVASFTPEVIAASCADYRAGATFDSDLDEADRAAGRTISCPVHALWGDRRRDDLNEAFLATWRRWVAPEQPVTGTPLPCGHFIPEELPDACTSELLAFLA